MHSYRVLVCTVLGLIGTICQGTVRNLTAQETNIDFNRDIRGLLFGKCVNCHGPDEEERAADLRLDTEQGAHDYAVTPGDASASELMLRITSDDDDLRMPPPGKGEAVTPAEIELLRRWIDQGARYATHWSYLKPVRHEPPPVESPPVESSPVEPPPVHEHAWITNPIDHFTLAKMHSHGLRPSPAADRLTLARRLAIDLTGLPPTWTQAQTFAADPAADAYEKYVDSLLADPAFGERWAHVWLDLARYADSAGYADDPARTIWAYRDYVITALNDNIPFDQFTIEQIAGDLLPNASERTRIATAFHRNTMTNNEGGTNDEEFRTAAIVDRVNTTMAVWMGTTMACAQCHTHKYDPITHEDYFSFYAFFNQTADRDLRDERPTLDVWSPDQKAQQANWTAEIAQLDESLKRSTPELESQRDAWIETLAQPPQWSVCHVDAQADVCGLRVDPEGQIHADHATSSTDHVEPVNDRYQLQWQTDEQPITALQIRIPRSQTDNFVITHVDASFVPDTSAPTQARFVRVELPGKGRMLHLAEIEAFSNEINIATSGTASQVSTYADAVAARVNDGNTNGDYDQHSVQHTLAADDAWVEIDLGSVRPIDRVVLWNRTDGGPSIQARLDGFVVKLLDEARQLVSSVSADEASADKATGDEPNAARHEFDMTGARQITFLTATADFEQKGFPAKSTVLPKRDRNTGWAVSPNQGQPHELTLPFAEPLPRIAGTLTLRLEQESVHEQHVLQHFSVMATSDSGVTQWARLPQSIREIVSKPREHWTPAELAAVDAQYRALAPELAPLRDRHAELTERLEQMTPVTTVPVMQELPADDRRVTRIQLRGNYLSTGDTVTARTPTAFHPLEMPENDGPPDRLALAQWLVSPENPLTSRVIVNRHWEQIFGVGIVETSEEFGSQGEPPSHPELLDWLAVELQESGWNLKHLIKLMVMSSTYRQQSTTSADAVQFDPDNRWLARGPRFRASAEVIRDQTLAVSGLLSEKRFGPPVNPPQPSLGLKAAFGGATDWTNSQGEDRYRRGLYTTWRRSSPYPSMAQFDAPNREVCTVRRIRTNTPLQALVTLNDPVYVEAAQALARKLIAASDDPADRLETAFHDCLTRDPTPSESERLMQLVRTAAVHYAEHPDDAVVMATDPLGPLPPDAQERAAEFAAWTTVANVILNLDEMLMKR